MNRLMNRIAFVILCAVSMCAMAVLWPFAVAGVLSLAISGMKFNRRVSSGLALVLVLVWRAVKGSWIISIGDPTPEFWYYDLLPGLVSWAVAAILVPGFAQWPSKFAEGYGSKPNSRREPAGARQTEAPTL